ncbi:hypothetical protein ETU10_02570 [Apibacter muscae]|uniref:phage baseplate assembly protein V n=1 Tax=Apibacter muscae TaxID=2509004 RepID=UPI0011ABDF3D|nr:phage baseplate assembly protein V [Apibacter muscae]TWP24864.1 hypothetical protein ETU10_02570 [Apibacter muscae]
MDHTNSPYVYHRKGNGDFSDTSAVVTLNGKEISLRNSIEVKISQEMLSHTTYHLICPSEAFGDKDAYPLSNSKQLLGSNLSIQFRKKGETIALYTGVVTRVNYKKKNKYPFIVIEAKSFSVLLDTQKRCRSYLNQSLKEILNKAFSEYSGDRVEFICEPNYSSLITYTVSYNETIFAFMQRLAIRYGEYFFWNGSQLIFGRGNQRRTSIYEGQDYLEYEISTGVAPQHSIRENYYPSAASVQSLNSKTFAPSNSLYLVNPFLHHAVTEAKKIYPSSETSFYFDALSEDQDIEQQNKLKIQQSALENLVWVEAKTTQPGLRLGDIAKMLAHIPEIQTFENGKKVPIESYLIQKIEHTYDTHGYRNEFSAIPREQLIAPYWDENAYPRAEDQSAVVAEVDDPLKMNRVRLRFFWQKGESELTPWVRLVQGYAGQDRGLHLMPEKGEEVLVSFRRGNAEFPVVTGSLNNGSQISNYQTEDNRFKVLKTKQGEKLEFEELKNIVLADRKGNQLHIEIDKDTLTLRALDIINILAPYINIEAEKNLTLRAGQKMLSEAFEKMLVNTPFMQQLVSDYYHTQAGKALINSQNEIKLESPETYVQGGQKLFLHSDELATLNSKGIAEFRGETKNALSNKADVYTPQQYKIEAKCTVQFRPHNNWDGEFGFDWMRLGDTGRNPGDTKAYKDIVGKNRVGGKISNNNYGKNIVPDSAEYTKLLKKYNVLSVPFTKDFYIVPWASLFKDKTAKFSLKLHIEEPPKKLEFKYDKTLFQLNKTEITTKTKGKHTLPDYLTVKCIKTFNADQYIDVYADEKLAGRLKIHKNGKLDRRKIDIVLAPVKTKITPQGETGKIIGEEAKLKKYLGQALITPNIIIDNSINLSNDHIFERAYIRGGQLVYGHDSSGRGKLHTYMISNYNLAGKYPGAFIIYIFDLPCPGTGGEVFEIPSYFALVYEYASRKPTCLVHELLHGLGLYHTFDNDSTFTFPKNTENIMDYTNTRYATWKWQWDLIRKHSQVKPE